MSRNSEERLGVKGRGRRFFRKNDLMMKIVEQENLLEKGKETYIAADQN